MPLILHEIIHVSLSILTAYIFYPLYSFTDVSFVSLMIIAIIGGVLIDLDHLIDYYIAYGWDFNLHRFLNGREFEKNKKIYVLFHGYEYVLIVFLIGFTVKDAPIQAYIFTLAISSLFHLLVDASLNGVLFQTYSILFRLKHNFLAKYLTK